MDLSQEVRDGYLVSSQMKKIWNIQLDLAKRLLDVCAYNNLHIWADSGTLLGTIRHKGFIPWDDDMDFVMLRKDYDKLIKLAHNFEHPYFLQSINNEPGYSRFHAQLRNSATSAILSADIWQQFNQGIFIDIFVLDNFPDNRDEWHEPCKHVSEARSYMVKRNYSSLLNKNLKSIFTTLELTYKFRNTTFKKYITTLEDRLRAQECGKEGNLVNVVFCKDIYKYPARKLRWFLDTVYMPFEDIMMPCPKGYHEMLSAVYGSDYMTPHKVTASHGSVSFSIDKPYKETLKNIRKSLPIKEKIKGLFMLPYKK